MRSVSIPSYSILLLSGVLLVQSSFAQQRPRTEPRFTAERLEAVNDTLLATLNLTEDQIPAVRTILANRLESLMALRPESGQARKQFQSIRVKRYAIDKESELALSKILSSQQMSTYQSS